MVWQGTLIGAGVGLLMGGPLGALIGSIAGYRFLDQDSIAIPSHTELSSRERERVQTAYLAATFSVMGHLAKVDGRVDEREIATVQEIMAELGLTGTTRQTAQRQFSEGKNPEFPLEDVLRRLSDAARRREGLVRRFLEFQFRLAFADGEIRPEEDALLHRIKQLLDYPEADFSRLEQTARNDYMRLRGQEERTREHERQKSQQEEAGTKLDAAYKLLGVSKTTPDDAIRAAYRRKLSQHHPDKLAAKGLSEELMKMAAHKTQEIREAYDLIRKSRDASAAKST